MLQRLRSSLATQLRRCLGVSCDDASNHYKLLQRGRVCQNALVVILINHAFVSVLYFGLNSLTVILWFTDGLSEKVLHKLMVLEPDPFLLWSRTCSR